LMGLTNLYYNVWKYYNETPYILILNKQDVCFFFENEKAK
jgi:hypothetical protein